MPFWLPLFMSSLKGRPPCWAASRNAREVSWMLSFIQLSFISPLRPWCSSLPPSSRHSDFLKYGSTPLQDQPLQPSSSQWS